MDFCQLLHKAKNNDKTTANGARYYSTKFEPPKKMKKENKDLSANIKKFLAKQEEEERKKQLMDQKKKEELLALRSQDKKATRRVNVMLKSTKSANKSVIEDAVDNRHTAVTRAGPEQPDEDDYGYVSQEASAFYEKMMEKYSQIPEEPKFNLLKKKNSANLSSIKNRVKAALDKEEEEAMQPRKRKRKKKEGEECDGEEKDDFKDEEPSKKADTPKPKPKPKSGPPPMSFNELLKMAAQKQHEPIMIEEKPQEEEKLYTKKQKKELEKERELRERKERRDREREEKDKPKPLKTGSGILERQLSRPLPNGKSPIKPGEKDKPTNPQKPKSDTEKVGGNLHGKPNKLPTTTPPPKSYGVPSKPPETHKIPKPGLGNGRDEKTSKSVIPKKNGVLPMVVNGKPQSKPKEFPPKDLINKNKPKPLPPRQFPPPDVRGVKRKQPIVSRGRILDDDDEEYDSEMDDFIDDDPQEGDYSKYIKEIFGYDKARYRDVDDDVDNMESSFAQQMREEVVSAKIGIMEDLEDIKKEEEAKRRKALMKKKMKK